MLSNIRLPILVTGLPGVPGWALFRRLRALFATNNTDECNFIPVLGTGPVDNRAIVTNGVEAVDAEDEKGWRTLFAKYAFGTVIDASGNCALRACECDPELSDMLNRRQGLMVAQLCAQYGSSLLRLSTDMVFSGTPGIGGYRENDPCDPVNNYGKSMARAEEEILRVCPSAQIMRLSIPMDWSPGMRAGAIDWISWRFAGQRPATLFFDEIRNAIHGADILPACLGILQKGSAGEVWHCGGARAVSLYQIGQMVNVAGNFSPKLLRGCWRQEAGPIPPRAGHMGMDISKLQALLGENSLRPMPWNPALFPGEDRSWHFDFDRRQIPPHLGMEELLVQGVSIFGGV